MYPCKLYKKETRIPCGTHSDPHIYSNHHLFNNSYLIICKLFYLQPKYTKQGQFLLSDLRVCIHACYFCVHVCPRLSNGKGLLEFVAVILEESSLVTGGNEGDHSTNQAFITMAASQLSSQSEIINRHVPSQVHIEILHGKRERVSECER